MSSDSENAIRKRADRRGFHLIKQKNGAGFQLVEKTPLPDCSLFVKYEATTLNGIAEYLEQHTSEAAEMADAAANGK